MTRIKGVLVPFQFTYKGYPEASLDERCLHDSVFTVLSTIPGERVMRPDFGSFLRLIVFDNINRAAGFRAKYEVIRSLRQWEPRISVTDVTFEISDTTLTVHVTWVSNGNLQATTSLTLPRSA